MQEEGGSQRARFARDNAMEAAVAPEPAKVPDFLVNYLQVVGAVEAAQDATAIEPALPDDFVDDVGNNGTPKRSLVKQAHQFARVTAFGIRHEYRHDHRHDAGVRSETKTRRPHPVGRRLCAEQSR